MKLITQPASGITGIQTRAPLTPELLHEAAVDRWLLCRCLREPLPAAGIVRLACVFLCSLGSLTL